MEQSSLHVSMRQFEKEMIAMISGVDIFEIDAQPRALIASLRTQMVDARLDMRDYEYANTRFQQTKYARCAALRLEGLRKTILAVSEYDIFGAIDVVHLSAKIDVLLEGLA